MEVCDERDFCSFMAVHFIRPCQHAPPVQRCAIKRFAPRPSAQWQMVHLVVNCYVDFHFLATELCLDLLFSESGFPELRESDPRPQTTKTNPQGFHGRKQPKLWQFHSDAWWLLRPNVFVHLFPKSVWLWSLLASDPTKNRTTSNCTLRARVRKVFIL